MKNVGNGRDQNCVLHNFTYQIKETVLHNYSFFPLFLYLPLHLYAKVEVNIILNILVGVSIIVIRS